MSHYTTIETKIRDREALLLALADLGYPTVETHEQPAHLFGYMGEERPELAHVIIRRAQIGNLSNDIGFARDEAGCYRAIVSEYDSREHGADWQRRLAVRYGYHATVRAAQRHGFRVTSETSIPATVNAGGRVG